MKVLLLLTLFACAVCQQAAARERQLHGVGPEGERVVASLSIRDPSCADGETAAEATWPDGTVRRGCLRPRYSVYQPILIRWRSIVDGRAVERTVDYSGYGLGVRWVR